MDTRAVELSRTIRRRRVALGETLDQLDERVTEFAKLPARVRSEVVLIGRWTAIILGLTAVTLTSVLVVRAMVRSRYRGGRGRR